LLKSIEFEKAIQPLVEALCKRLRDTYDIYAGVLRLLRSGDRKNLAR
jgi:nitrate reductase assembly molybdenum cofactor insertion protein NarJ